MTCAIDESGENYLYLAIHLCRFQIAVTRGSCCYGFGVSFK